jgi:RNase H-like domain found in reverse transcriptase/Reverse transcriptase (RNA-dependent DNA polymerase)
LHDYFDDFVIAYLDDILISTDKGREHYLRQVRKVLKKLEEKGFKINIKKMKITVSEVKFLGIVINHKGIRINPDKIKAVKAWPELKTVKEVQGFLGLTNYYQRFVQGYVEKTELLTWLLKKDTRFIWQDTHRSAFELLKNQFEVGKILIAPDPQKLFRVETDASKWALSGVLYQEKNRQWRPIAFHS